MSKKAKKKKAAKAKAAKPKAKKKGAVKAAVKTAAKVVAKKQAAEPAQRLLNFKVFDTEYETMKKLARKHSGGNLSAWVRFATVNAKPTPQQQKRFDAGDY